jgi:hypothetical protein
VRDTTEMVLRLPLREFSFQVRISVDGDVEASRPMSSSVCVGGVVEWASRVGGRGY